MTIHLPPVPQRHAGAAGSGAALYAAVARLGFRRPFAYPQAALWGVVTNAFFGLLRVSVLAALFGVRPQVAGYSVTDAVTYTALTQAFIVALALFGWTDFMRTVHRGEVGTDLLRPMNLLGFWAAQDAGRAAAQFVLRGLPMLLIFQLGAAFTGGGLHWPAGPLAWTQTILSAALAWACGFLFRFLVNCAAFWSPDAAGFGRFAWALLGLGCGFLMPLAFFPAWAQAALACTPFPSMLNTTVEVWLGLRSGPGAWVALGTQLAWTGALLAVTAFTLRRGLRRLEVAGG